MASQFQQLTATDVPRLKELLRVFADAFDDHRSYQSQVPTDAYLEALLASPYFVVVVGIEDGAVVGGLACYELQKFEQDRRELYIYDLAVAEPHRRKGVASGLIQTLKQIAATRGAYVIYVQADRDDEPAIALYESLGTREEVYHFDFVVGHASVIAEPVSDD